MEIDEQHGRRWDDVLVKKYFVDVREARKQGRKEQRHKQAQVVLAAATAAAATSSRNTSVRKDMTEEPAQQEVVVATFRSFLQVLFYLCHLSYPLLFLLVINRTDEYF